MGFLMKFLQKAALIAALSLPTYAQAEVIEFQCSNKKFPQLAPSQLLVDTNSGKIKYAFWPWSSDSAFTDELILWTVIDIRDREPIMASFILKRATGELSIQTFDLRSFYRIPDYMIEPILDFCVRPF